MPKSQSPSSQLERGRAAYERRAWQDAFDALRDADRLTPLATEDLERLGWAAALSGHDEMQIVAFERLHDACCEAGDTLGAVRAAFWAGFKLLFMGEVGRGTGWIGRAQRLLEQSGTDSVERGYLLIPQAYGVLFAGPESAQALEMARRAGEIGERFGDPNLVSLARLIEGQALVGLGRDREGLALLDEAILPATRGALQPVVTGIVYCAVIGCCHRVFAIDRAREWTAALAAWCESQPQLAAFTGACRAHRSEILQLQGAWGEAIEEAKQVARRLANAPVPEGAALARYQEAEIHRLRGDYAAAEKAYREAGHAGHETQPGLALLRLAQGETAAAIAAIRGAVAATHDPMRRARLLPAAVEILLASGDLEGARETARELEHVAAGSQSEVLGALAAHALGAVRLAEGDAEGSIEPLRFAFLVWQKVGAPYLAVRIRVAIAKALEALGDGDGARLERAAARAVFEKLGATPDLVSLDAASGMGARHPFGLTPRELEVLRFLASGRTNRAISQQLFLSEKTIDRHVSNIFAKLDVPSRAAATAFAYQHKLV